MLETLLEGAADSEMSWKHEKSEDKLGFHHLNPRQMAEFGFAIWILAKNERCCLALIWSSLHPSRVIFPFLNLPFAKH